MENMKHWNNLNRPPQRALKQIGGGRLKGKTDINPQWRYEAMTQEFGVCGIGWKYEVKRLWTEAGAGGEVFAFAEVLVYVRDGEKWSDGIPGIGGHFLIEKESAGLHNNDEAFKMATTDALSVALKMLGVAADIYAGLWDGAKYKDGETPKRLGDDPLAHAIQKNLDGVPVIPLTDAQRQFVDGAFDSIQAAQTMDELKKAWTFITQNYKQVPDFYREKLTGQKDAKKLNLTKKEAA
jgi:hypothetical protein